MSASTLTTTMMSRTTDFTQKTSLLGKILEPCWPANLEKYSPCEGSFLCPALARESQRELLEKTCSACWGIRT